MERIIFEWSQSVHLVIDGKGKLGYLNGEVTPPTTNDPKYRQQHSENSMVTVWLINSMDPIIGKTFIYVKTDHDVWEAVRETYLDMENQAQSYEISTRMWKMQQGNHNIRAYYNDMMVVWQELDLFGDEQWENSNDSARYKKKVERGWVFVFLVGLNKKLDKVRGCILGQKSLPTIREVFSEVRREEARHQVMLKNNDK